MSKSEKKCYYCGNNPVPHFVWRLSSWLDFLTNAFPLRRWVGYPVEKWIDRLTGPVLRLLIRSGAIKYNDDVAKASSVRPQVIWKEAAARGIRMRQLVVFGKLTDNFEATLKNGRTIYFQGMPFPEKDRYSDSLRWMDDKFELKRRLAASGIPVPKAGVFSRFGPMREFFKGMSKPVIVKPVTGSRGRHTTTFIYTEAELKDAFEVGRQISRQVVMEEHLYGSVYRGTIIDGKLVGVFRGDPPRVTGDGKRTIRELIEIKNKNKHPRMSDFKASPLTEKFLARNNLNLDSVLPTGRTIDLTEKIGLSYGGFRAETFDICHEETKKILEAAGRVVGTAVSGFDFIIPDISKSPHGQKWGIIECNSLPWFDLHHDPVEGRPINVSKYFWDMWEAKNY